MAQIEPAVSVAPGTIRRVISDVVAGLAAVGALASALYARNAVKKADQANELAEESNRISRDAAQAARREAEAAERALRLRESEITADLTIVGNPTYKRGTGGCYVWCSIANRGGVVAQLSDLAMLAGGDRYPSGAIPDPLQPGRPMGFRFDLPLEDMINLGPKFPFRIEGLVVDATGSRPFAIPYPPAPRSS